MQIQLTSLAKEIKAETEVLAFNGLNLVSQENIREIELFLQQASQVQAFRLATSLRYLHVELNRFMTHHPAFNVERYVFFLNNCWLLSSACLSNAMPALNDPGARVLELMGKPSEPVAVEQFDLRLAGLEKVYLENALFGLIFHFFSKSGETSGNILKLSIMQQPKGLVNPEILLGMNIPNTEPPVPFFKLLASDIVMNDARFLEREETIQLAQDSKSTFTITEDTSEEPLPFPLELYERFMLHPAEINARISGINITPFDTSVLNVGYAFIKNATITSQYKEGDDQGVYKTSTRVFTILHDQGYPLQARLPDKQVNNTLATNLGVAMEAGTVFPGMFGKLTIERGHLVILPLSCIDEEKVWFPCLARDMKINNKEILQYLYSQNKQP